MKPLAFFAIFVVATTTSFGAGPSDILGTWRTDGDESKVEIFRCKEMLCGKIVWLKNPTYTDSNEGQVGTPIIDRKNPDPVLRSRPLMGLQILNGFTEQGENTWGQGTCYDPKSGKTYKGKMHMAAPGRLELRGFIGISLFGRTSVWKR